jgi:16S rRNA (cytosine967-C5)-methyltransferase
MSSPGLGPRAAAWRILHDVHRGVPFDLALDRSLTALEEPDKRLAHELAAGALRQRAPLDAAIAPHVSAGIDSVRADLLDILRLGAYQLLFLERVPSHAAVSTSVDLARRVSGARVGAFVNAVLRRVAEKRQEAGGRRQEAAASEKPPASSLLPPASATDLATIYSHPEWLVARWAARFGLDEAERLLAWNNTRPQLVLQPARWDESAIIPALDRAEVRWAHAPFGAGIVVEVTRPRDLPGFTAGAFHIQDPAQALAVRFFGLPERGTLFDACAAPGGKALGLSTARRFIAAADLRLPRVLRLRGNLARAGRGPFATLVADAEHAPVRPVEAVLLDVPCLGTGTMVRNPDARWRVSAEALARLTAQGARLLRALARSVRPGGMLCFATCSLEPEENASQVDAFLAEDSRFRREPGNLAPELMTDVGDFMTLPQRHGMDGAYAARLRRVG